jgi:hypothetical protein
MSFAIHFDTLGYTKKLKDAGFTARQAEAQVEIMTETLDHLVTKSDLNHAIKELRGEINTLELRMTIKLGAMLIVAISILAVIIKF